jgi:hypothetical protein
LRPSRFHFGLFIPASLTLALLNRVQILVDPPFAADQAVSFSGSLGFKDGTPDAFDKDTSLWSVRKNTALGTPVRGVGIDLQRLSENQVSFVSGHIDGLYHT